MSTDQSGAAPGAEGRAAGLAAGRADPSLPAAVPLLLEPAGARAGRGRARHRDLAAGDRGGGRARRAADPFLGRRADAAARSAGAGPACGRARPVHQPDHRRACCSTQAKVDALAEAGLDHVQISIQDSEPGNANRIGGYKDGHARKLAVARLVRERGPAAHDQRRDASPEPRAARRDHRAGGRARRQAARGRAHPVLRLGAAQPRGADADPRRRPSARSRWSRRRARGSRACS